MEKSNQPRRLASSLPPELLLAIFCHISRRESLDSWEPRPPSPDAWSIARVCRAWHDVSLEILYHIVSVRTVESLQLFHRTLLGRVDLRSRVKVLRLPVNSSKTCPAPIMTLMTQIVSMVDCLTALTCPTARIPQKLYVGMRAQSVTPISPGKHQQLSYLNMTGMVQYQAILHPQLSAFQSLRYLKLGGFRLSRLLDPDTTPTLPKLEVIDVDYDDNIPLMDEWLLACPSLTTIFVSCNGSLEIAPRVMTSGRIIRLGIKECMP